MYATIPFLQNLKDVLSNARMRSIMLVNSSVLRGFEPFPAIISKFSAFESDRVSTFKIRRANFIS